ncbi:MAG TPA: phosphate signaling complex protein PhoU [Usitatibacter sp.]|nr:phosphate signaling complex protein PhoU [Usitatibacter sp.]
MTDHIYRQFDQDLEAIRSQMMRMGGLVETQVRQAIGAFLEADAARAVALIAADAEVNELELAIDNEVAQTIVRRQPAASDLRLLLSASKIVTDLERIGDEATKVARLARERARGTAHGSAALRHVSDVAIGMLRQALDAFARLDAAAAARVCGEDASIDEEFRAIMRQLITFMMEDARTITASLQVVWAAKAFERIGDHARNIAEHVIYIVKGRDVRHIPLAELEKEALGR